MAVISEKIHSTRSMGCSSSRCQQQEGRGRKEEASAEVGTAVIGETQRLVMVQYAFCKEMYFS